jgi:hypothetical protein
MRTPELPAMPHIAPGSPRVLTHYAPHCADEPWCAVNMEAACQMLKGYELTEEEKNSVPAIMAGYCRLIDEANLIGFGMTEEEAVRDCLANAPAHRPAREQEQP